MKCPADLSYIYSLNIINILSQTYFNSSHRDEVSIVLCNDLDVDSLQIMEGEHMTDQHLQEVVFELDSLNQVKGMIPYLDLPITYMKIPPSILQVPKIKLKPLFEHLNYIFLGEGETLLVITSNKLSRTEERN